jgi:hypothetical protein
VALALPPVAEEGESLERSLSLVVRLFMFMSVVRMVLMAVEQQVQVEVRVMHRIPVVVGQIFA